MNSLSVEQAFAYVERLPPLEAAATLRAMSASAWPHLKRHDAERVRRDWERRSDEGSLIKREDGADPRAPQNADDEIAAWNRLRRMMGAPPLRASAAEASGG